MGEKAFVDVSEFDNLVLPVRSATPDYSGFQFGFGFFLQKFNATSQWSDVVLPLSGFKSPTSPKGPTKAELSSIKELAVWAFEAAGNVSLDLQWIKATASKDVLV